ncbi:MAG TPA: hypothetical protein VHX88_14775 [Solirubrobacteraceae bacterium]|nr:hypothetical protein [Solirubrobacteraceae bacterium]
MARRVYGEAVSSDTTRTAVRLLRQSPTLRAAIRTGNPREAQAAVAPLLADRHLARLTILRNGRSFISVGPADALVTTEAHLGPRALMMVSVQTASGLVETVLGLTGGAVSVRDGARTIAGRSLVSRPLPASGVVTVDRHPFAAVSFTGRLYSGAPVQIGLLRSYASLAPLCSATPARTAIQALAFTGLRIYAQENGLGGAVAEQMARVEHDGQLLRALAHHDRRALRIAIDDVLNQHIVRLRVIGPRGLIVDVGGPHVLAPHSGELYLRGRPIGSFVLSVQDDLGYLLLAQRLVGVDVLMREGATQVLGTLSPGPANPPAFGPVIYEGRRYETYSFQATAFPAGPLRISLLAPIRVTG